jgi:hypothetical protein
MPKPIYPDSFHTEVINEGFYVFGDNNAILSCANMRSLSNKLLNNEKVDAHDRAIAGAMISHLISVLRGPNKKSGPMKAGDEVMYRDITWPAVPGWNGRGKLLSPLTYDDNDKRGYYIQDYAGKKDLFVYVGNVRRLA